VYKDILSLGFSESESFLFSHFFNRMKKGKSFPVSFVPLYTGHAVLGVTNSTESYCRNFLLGTAKGADKTTFQSAKGYSGGVFSLWKDNKVHESSALNNWIKGLRPLNAKAKKNLNIFHKKPTSGWEVPDGDAFKDIIAQALERIYNAA
jgi:hypothetical protein